MRKMKFKTYGAIMIIGLIICLLLINYFVSQMDSNYDLSMDMTAYRIYSLTSATDDVLDKLDEDIFIYTTETAGIEDDNIKELLHNYSTSSKLIHVVNVDIVKNPGAVEYYNEFANTNVAAGSVIVSNSANTNDRSQRYDILGYEELYTYNEETQVYDRFNAEDAITGGIKYVTNPNNQKVWLLDNHSIDNSANNAVKEILEHENYNVEMLSILNGQSPLESEDIVIVIGLESDLTDTELDVLNEFLDDGGKMILGIDPAVNETVNLNNALSIMGRYNIKMGQGIVKETDLDYVAVTRDSEYVYSFIIPKMAEHELTNQFIIADYKLLLGMSVGQMILPDKVNDPNMTIQPLLLTSEKAYIEPWGSYMDNNPNEGAQYGEFTVMASVTDEEKNTKLIALTAPELFTQAQAFSQNVYRNKDFLLKTVSYLGDDEGDFYISSKPLINSPMMIETMKQAYIIIGIVCIAIPLVIFAAGIFIYIKRKNL